MDNIERFLKDEIDLQEMYDAIYEFIDSPHIRTGEFEANIFIIKKMDLDNFLIFPEYIYPHDNHREIPYCISIDKESLLRKINLYAKNQGLLVRGMGH